MKRPALYALALWTASLAACYDAEPTEVVLVVTSELATPTELDNIHIRIVGPEGRVETATADLRTQGFPRTLSIQHPEGTLGPFIVTATGRLGGVSRVERRAVFSLLEAQSRHIELPLHRDCVQPSISCLCPDTRVCSTCDVGPECRDAVVRDKSREVGGAHDADAGGL